MQEALSSNGIEQLLSDLAETLGDERAALIHVDTEGIERTAARKCALNDALARHRPQFNASHRAKLRVIQTQARHNLILLVHARDYIQTTLGILTGRPTIVGQLPTAVAESVRLDLRG
jgi:hypothetical protein